MTDFQFQKATVKCNNQHKINKFRPSSNSPSLPAGSSQPGDERFGVHRANPAFSPVELVLTLILNDGLRLRVSCPQFCFEEKVVCVLNPSLSLAYKVLLLVSVIGIRSAKEGNE